MKTLLFTFAIILIIAEIHAVIAYFKSVFNH